MSVEIREVNTKKELKQFVKFGIDLYKGNPYHVPGLIEEEMMTLDKDKNPAFEVCDAILYLAYREGKIVGRIAGIINHGSNKAWEEKRARFGFVEFIDDAEVVDALFDAVIRWAKSKGMNELHGPLGFTDMDHEGYAGRRVRPTGYDGHDLQLSLLSQAHGTDGIRERPGLA